MGTVFVTMAQNTMLATITISIVFISFRIDLLSGTLVLVYIIAHNDDSKLIAPEATNSSSNIYTIGRGTYLW
jgi:hypothetical protein